MFMIELLWCVHLGKLRSVQKPSNVHGDSRFGDSIRGLSV